MLVLVADEPWLEAIEVGEFQYLVVVSFDIDLQQIDALYRVTVQYVVEGCATNDFGGDHLGVMDALQREEGCETALHVRLDPVVADFIENPFPALIRNRDVLEYQSVGLRCIILLQALEFVSLRFDQDAAPAMALHSLANEVVRDAVASPYLDEPEIVHGTLACIERVFEIRGIGTPPKTTHGVAVTNPVEISLYPARRSPERRSGLNPCAQGSVHAIEDGIQSLHGAEALGNDPSVFIGFGTRCKGTLNSGGSAIPPGPGVASLADQREHLVHARDVRVALRGRESRGEWRCPAREDRRNRLDEHARGRCEIDDVRVFANRL